MFVTTGDPSLDRKRDASQREWGGAPEGTLVLLEGLVDQHVSLQLVLPVEGRLAQRAAEGLLPWNTRPAP